MCKDWLWFVSFTTFQEKMFWYFIEVESPYQMWLIHTLLAWVFLNLRSLTRTHRQLSRNSQTWEGEDTGREDARCREWESALVTHGQKHPALQHHYSECPLTVITQTSLQDNRDIISYHKNTNHYRKRAKPKKILLQDDYLLELLYLNKVNVHYETTNQMHISYIPT